MDPASLHRRLYRLALLLTGRPEQARHHAVAVARPTVKRRGRGQEAIPPAVADRLERQVLLACRREPPGSAGRTAASVPIPAFGRLEAMPTQFREAFVLVRVLGRSLREAARAMDCSRTAVRRHLAQADAALIAGETATAERHAQTAAQSAASPSVVESLVRALRDATQHAPDIVPVGPRTEANPRARRLRHVVIALAVGAAIFVLWRAWHGWREAASTATAAESVSAHAPPTSTATATIVLSSVAGRLIT